MTSSQVKQPIRGACFSCQSTEHYANTCPVRKAKARNQPGDQSKGNFPTRSVNLCEVNPPGSLLHNGESFEFIFDSGSECSLLRTSLQSKFSGPVFETPIVLTGIGMSKVISFAQKVSEVIIDGNHLNVCFHIVPDECVNQNIIIGREILGMGVKVVLTPEKCIFVPCTLNLSQSLLKKYGSDVEPKAITRDLDLDPNPPHVTVPTETSITDMRQSNSECVPEILETLSIETESNKINADTRTDYFSSTPTDVDPGSKSELVSILSKYKDFFSDGLPTARIKTGELKIRLIDPSKIVRRRPYPLSDKDKKFVREHIAELEKAQIVRKSTSPFASPILLVPKKNGKLRMCVDYRQLNSNIVRQHYPLPLIKDQIARLAGACYFSTLDMASGYNALPIHPDSVEMTSFVTPEAQYEYLTMPYGLVNGSSVYQAAIVAALGPLANECCTAFIDDILVYAKSETEALTNLDKVLEALTVRGGFTLNLSKCSFIVKKVSYLGFEISAGEIRPNKDKVNALITLPPPTNITSLRQFIGLASYFRQFIPNFSSIAEPLYRLMTNKSDLIWLPEHETARQKLIAYLTEEPVLMIFDPNLPIELHCDACSLGYAGILIQIVDNKPRVVSYFSKRTTPAESRYHSYEQETLAVVQSIRHFRTYLQYVPFTVVTDCKSLKESYLKQDLNTRVHRWWSFMQAFDFKIVYRPAHKMQHADFLSRHPPLSDNSLSLIVDLSDKFPEKRVDLTSLPDDWLMLAQRQDSELAEIVSKIENRDINESIDSSYEIRSGILCRKIQRNNRTRCVPIVPHSYKWSVVNNVHEGVMHLGWEKTLEKVADFYWFKSMSKFVRKFVENCLTCKIAKTPSGKTQVQLHPIPKTVAPWHTVHIDVSGKLSGKNDAKEYLIVMIDSFTKYVLLYHTRKVDTESAVKALKQSISLFAAPSRIIADQGRCFASAEFKQYCNSHQIELHLIATGAARANAQVERVMSVLTNLLTATELGERSWQDAVLDIQLAINCTINRVTRCSPLELMIGKVGRPSSLVVPTAIDTEIVPLEVVRDTATQNMIKSARYDKSRFDRGKAKVKPMSVGDLVFIQNEPRNQMKLSPKFKGPFKIIEVLEHDRYLLKSLTTKRTYKYPHEKLRLAPNLSLNEIDTQSNDLNAESDDERNEESDSLSNAA